MNTLMRNSTLAISSRRRRLDHYEALDQDARPWGPESRHAPRSTSKAKREPQHMISSFSYRRERAKKRQIYLRSYKLSSTKTRTECTSMVLKKGLVKAKSVFVKMIAFVRINSLMTCGSSKRQSLCYSSPISIRCIPRRGGDGA